MNLLAHIRHICVRPICSMDSSGSGGSAKEPAGKKVTHSHTVKENEEGLRSDEALGVNRVRDISLSGWKAIFKAVFKSIEEDHVMIVSAGVAFFFFLAVFPAIAAAIAIYSLIQDPAVIQEQINAMSALFPDQAYELIDDTLTNNADRAQTSMGWSVFLAILLAIWSSKKGMNAVFQGINVAYKQRDPRGFFLNNLLTLGFTLGALIFGLLVLSLLALFPILTDALHLSGWGLTAANTVRWICLMLLITLALGMIFRVAPARVVPGFRWITPGSATACGLWMIGSFMFAWYTNHFGRFNEIYGSFAAVAILMLWFYLTSFVILLGAEINAHVEDQSNRE